MSNQDEHLRKAIRSIIESLGKLNSRAFHGNGTSSPYIVRSVKQQLGPVQMPENELEAPDKTSVKISRVFLKKSSD
tara:strand:- start:8871 stop:9098 length:228 start_codon:yes stop_codon:yes gene_type:complete